MVRGPNETSYAGLNPTRFSDPTGQWFGAVIIYPYIDTSDITSTEALVTAKATELAPQVQSGKITACQAAVMLLTLAATNAKSSADAAWALQLYAQKNSSVFNGAGGSGFRDEISSTHGDDQVHHALGTLSGAIIAWEFSFGAELGLDLGAGVMGLRDMYQAYSASVGMYGDPSVSIEVNTNGEVNDLRFDGLNSYIAPTIANDIDASDISAVTNYAARAWCQNCGN